MKTFLRLASGSLIIAAAWAGGVSAQDPILELEPHVMYHYDSEGPNRSLVAVSGVNCDGSTYHQPLIYGHYTEYYPLTC